MSERFYVNCPLAVGEVVLDRAESHHLAVVCRLRLDDAVCLFNGDGHEYPARITTLERRQVVLAVEAVATPPRELGFRLEVAAPLPKGDRAQFLVEKLTELGATTFVPLRTRRSIVHPRDSKGEKLERWVIEASKQCGRNVLMKVAPLADWENYCRNDKLPSRRLLAHPGGNTRTGRREDRETRDVAIAVGPEGGFEDEEVECGRGAGWSAVDLGPRILRVETAAIMLAAMAGNASENRSFYPDNKR